MGSGLAVRLGTLGRSAALGLGLPPLAVLGVALHEVQHFLIFGLVESLVKLLPPLPVSSSLHH